MPKQMSTVRDGMRLFFQKYSVDDLIENIEHIPGISKEVLTKEKIKEVVLEFYKIMCEDLIMNNNCFHLPDRDLGMIYIKDVCDIDNPFYKFNFDTEGIMYQPVIINKYHPNKKIYDVRFAGDMKDLFKKEVLMNNHHY